MKLSNSKCEICGKPRKGIDHTECSKLLQSTLGKEQKNRAKKKISAKDFDYIARRFCET